MKTKGIIEALKSGYSLGCWASGGGVPVVSIMANTRETVASGEGGHIKESFVAANSDWSDYKRTKVPYGERKSKKGMLMTGAYGDNDPSIFGWLDNWVKSGSGYLQADFNSYSDVYIVMLDGYNDNFDKVIQLGFNEDLIKAIEIASHSPKVLKKE